MENQNMDTQKWLSVRPQTEDATSNILISNNVLNATPEQIDEAIKCLKIHREILDIRAQMDNALESVEGEILENEKYKQILETINACVATIENADIPEQYHGLEDDELKAMAEEAMKARDVNRLMEINVVIGSFSLIEGTQTMLEESHHDIANLKADLAEKKTEELLNQEERLIEQLDRVKVEEKEDSIDQEIFEDDAQDEKEVVEVEEEVVVEEKEEEEEIVDVDNEVVEEGKKIDTFVGYLEDAGYSDTQQKLITKKLGNNNPVILESFKNLNTVMLSELESEGISPVDSRAVVIRVLDNEYSTEILEMKPSDFSKSFKEFIKMFPVKTEGWINIFLKSLFTFTEGTFL